MNCLAVRVLFAIAILSLGFSVLGLDSMPIAQAQQGWKEYTDPYLAFKIAYPPDWILQNLPYKDFGFQISSPDLKMDPLVL